MARAIGNCGWSTDQDQQGNVINVTTEKDGDQWQEISQSPKFIEAKLELAAQGGLGRIGAWAWRAGRSG